MENIAIEILQTKNWIEQVVMGCNFCPFAAKVFHEQRIRYVVDNNSNPNNTIDLLMAECNYLSDNPSTATTFIIIPNNYKDFFEYLDVVIKAEKQLKKAGLEGVYQVASFHPQYCFAGSNNNDAANYTNRSPYPMLHILRENDVTAALNFYKNPDAIPEKNIAFAQQKGLAYMQQLFNNSLQ
ncbi:DUF1415 domain-containing protein [Ferruginibacter yonginensis]|uniref:DUF1415 domain-containing protein n=1 Tax=Ferruginibacter yonginensis TaxID=1310416 RepID=A0ABV8QV81_9BACT